MLRKTDRFAIVLMLSLAMLGCIHKPAGSAPVTPWERVTTDNAILAQMVNTIERGAEAANTSGVISKPTTAAILDYCSRGSTIQLQVNSLLATAPTVSTGSIASIQSLVNQMAGAATVLIQSGQIGVKNPTTQQLFSTDVQSAVTLANAVLSDIQIAKGGTQ